MDAYTEAHLFVAAIRILSFKKGRAPRMEEICELLSVSLELGHNICRKLAGLKIIEILEDPFSIMLSIADHTKIETLPRKEEDKDLLARELEAFQKKKQDSEQKVATNQDELNKKKQSMFAELEAKLKKEMKNKKG